MMQVGNYLGYPSATYDYKLYCLMTLKKAQEAGLISPEQYEDKQKEFLKAIKFVVEEGASDASMAFSNNNAVIPFNSAPKVPPQYNNYRGNGGFESNGGDYEEEYQSDYEEYADHHMVVLNNDGGRYGALTELGGTASLTKIYQYVFAHQSDIDPKFAYRFNKKGDYKSNVRSTLHNTGAFTQLPNGDWTVSSHLRGRR